MWKTIFELIFFIEPATGNFIIDLLLPIALTALLYGVVYHLVGDMYSEGLIAGSVMGSIFHWGIRLGLVYIIILLFNIGIKYFSGLLIVAAIIIVIFVFKKVKG